MTVKCEVQFALFFIEINNDPSRNFTSFQLLHRFGKRAQSSHFANGLQLSSLGIAECFYGILHVANNRSRDCEFQSREYDRIRSKHDVLLNRRKADAHYDTTNAATDV